MIEKKNFKLSIIIPCYNEKNTIEKILDKVTFSLKSYNYNNYEILIVDDFSTDGTREILKKFENKENIKIIFQEKNHGKGYAIKTAKTYVDGELILIQDADLEYDPFDYNKLLLPFFDHG